MPPNRTNMRGCGVQTISKGLCAQHRRPDAQTGTVHTETFGGERIVGSPEDHQANVVERSMPPTRSRRDVSPRSGLMGELVRVFVRASAVAGFAFTVGALAINPPPWASHWDLWKYGTIYAVGLGALTSCSSLGAGALATRLETGDRARRPMKWFLVLDVVTLIIGILTPAI
jgi:hypothetical protein